MLYSMRVFDQLGRHLQRRTLRRLALAALALPLLWVVQNALFGRSGYFALRRQERQFHQQQARLHALEARNRQLNRSVQALSSSPAAIEGIARQQLHLTRPGEVVYTYPVDGNASQGPAAADLR